MINSNAVSRMGDAQKMNVRSDGYVSQEYRLQGIFYQEVLLIPTQNPESCSVRVYLDDIDSSASEDSFIRLVSHTTNDYDVLIFCAVH